MYESYHNKVQGSRSPHINNSHVQCKQHLPPRLLHLSPFKQFRFQAKMLVRTLLLLHQHHHHHRHVSGLLKTPVIMAFQSYLSSVLMSSFLGDSFLVYVCLCILCVVCLCFWYHKSFAPNICFSNPSALFICPKNCSGLFSDSFK